MFVGRLILARSIFILLHVVLGFRIHVFMAEGNETIYFKTKFFKVLICFLLYIYNA